jgi:glucosyltransferase
MIAVPVVSILVTTYNQEAYIGQALDSLLAQECPFGYEILVGEDCSTDGTRAICIEYAKSHPDKIRLFLNEQNKGLLKNYFDLMEQARGMYLSDCGGDDYWLTTDRLKRQVELLQQHPEVSLVFGNWQILNQKDQQLEINKAGRSEDWYEAGRFGKEAIKDYLNERNFPRVVLSASCLRTAWLKEVMHGHPELFLGKGVVCEDLPMTLCLLNKGPFYLMKDEVLVYRVLEKSTSHSLTVGECLKGFSYDVFMQTLDLAESLGLSISDLGPYLKKDIPHFIFYAFVTRDIEWMECIVRDLRKYGIRLTRKQQFLYACIRTPWLNGLVLRAYSWLKGSPDKKLGI